MRAALGARARLAGLFLFAAPFAASASFERVPTGPATAASGEILALAADPVFGNPAQPAGKRGFFGELWGSRPFGIPELRESQVSFAALRGEGAGGVGFRTFDAGDYFEREARVTLSFAPTHFLASSRGNSPFTIGAAARVLFVGGRTFTMQTALAADLGLRARLDRSTEIAVLLEAVAGGAPGDPERRLPRSSLAASRTLPLRTRLLLEIGRRADRAPRLAGGLTCAPHPALLLCAGARADPPSVSWGLSLGSAGAVISISSTETRSLGRTVRVGIGWEPRIAQDATSLADP